MAPAAVADEAVGTAESDVVVAGEAEVAPTPEAATADAATPAPEPAPAPEAGAPEAEVIAPEADATAPAVESPAVESPAAETPADPTDITLTVEGVLELVMVEAPHEAGHDEAVPAESEAGHEAAEPSSEIVSFVQVDGEIYPLPDAAVVEGATGDQVVVTLEADAGMGVEDALDVVAAAGAEETAAIVSAVPAESGTLSALSETTSQIVLGGHTLTVLPVAFAGLSGPDVTTTTLTNTANATAAYWNTQSNGRLNVQPQVRAWQTVPNPGSCDTNAIMASALAAHGNPAISATQHVLVYFPQRTDCGGWAGMATVGGGKIWVNGSTLVDVSAHELGHNFGLGHANTMSCAVGGAPVPFAAPATTYCTQQAYGDFADVMGIGQNMATGNLNSAFAQYLGFAVTTTAASTPASSVVQLSPLGSFGALRAIQVATGEGEIFVDYRPAVAPDVRKTSWAGVQVHVRRTERSVPYTYLLDMRATSFSSPSFPLGAAWNVTGTNVRLGLHAIGSTATFSIDPMSATPPPADDGVDRYVTRVYSDLFGRAPDPTGLAGWGAALRAGTPRIAVANAITYSNEYRLGLIYDAYITYLGRAPETEGHLAWLGQMQNGVTIQAMEGGFVASNEYYFQAGGTDGAWIRKVYLDVLGRSASQGEVDPWVQSLAQGANRYTIAMSFLMSSEHLGTVVNGHYIALLGREIDPTGRAGWVSAIQSGSRVEAIIGGIIASNEYYNKP